jgi:hypothetical protein
MTEVRKLAEDYVKAQVRSWNDQSARVSKRGIRKAIAKVAKALQEIREASAKTAIR